MTRAVAITAVTLLGGGAGGLEAQQDAIAVTVSGDIRVRSEVDARTSGAGTDHATLLRTRVGVLATLAPTAGAFIQLSDSRAFGEELNHLTDASADRFDLHQAYGEWAPVGTLRLRAGRQELAFADERLIGPVGWANVNRAFDGVRATLTRPRVTLDLFAAVLDEQAALVPTGLDPRQNGGAGSDRVMAGAWAAGRVFDLFVIVDRNAAEGAVTQINRATFGGYLRRTMGPLSTRGTFAWQAGHQTGANGQRQDLAAFLASAAATYGFRGDLQPSVGIQVDYLSGDDSPGDQRYRAFNTLYATNHPFYGLMDLFLSFPAQTGGLGFVDLVARGSVVPHSWTVRADGHRFRLARMAPGGSHTIGTELDLTAARRVTRGFDVQLGYSLFSPSAAGQVAPFGLGSDRLHWGYVQATMQF